MSHPLTDRHNVANLLCKTSTSAESQTWSDRIQDWTFFGQIPIFGVRMRTDKKVWFEVFIAAGPWSCLLLLLLSERRWLIVWLRGVELISLRKYAVVLMLMREKLASLRRPHRTQCVIWVHYQQLRGRLLWISDSSTVQLAHHSTTIRKILFYSRQSQI